MRSIFKLFYVASAAFVIMTSQLFAAGDYPKISGEVFVQMQGDKVMGEKSSANIPSDNGFIYAQADSQLNFNKNWSVSTQWRLNPNQSFNTRNSENPERMRNFLSSDRGFTLTKQGLIVEELEVNYQNEDAKFSIGKFDPKFGNSHDPQKKLGIFTSQFNYDYYIREKIGSSITALLENATLNFSTFFNDTTDLSRSAIDDRGRSSRSSGMAGDTGTFSSYVVTLDGNNFLGRDNWKYTVGYRSLGVDKSAVFSREVGYILGTEYEHELGFNTTLVPFAEIVKIKNFSGISGRDATYTTLALTLKYKSWNLGVSALDRNLDAAYIYEKSNGRHLQLFAGYKFFDNFSFDVTHSKMKEDGISANMFGLSLAYLYKF